MREVKFVMDSADELLPMPEVAKKLGTSKKFVYRLVDAGLLPGIRLGRYRKVRKFALNEFLKAHEGKDLIECVEAREKANKRQMEGEKSNET